MRLAFRRLRLPLAMLTVGAAVTLGLLLAQTALADQPLFKLKPGLDYSKLDPGHRADLEHDERVIQEARARGNPPPKLGEVPRPVASPVRQQLVMGIDEQNSRYGSTTSFEAKNLWQSIVNGELLQVYAGSARNDDKQGMVRVQTLALDEYNRITGTTSDLSLVTPVAAGPVKIVEERGQQLVLRSDKGVTFTFDIPSRRFVEDGKSSP